MAHTSSGDLLLVGRAAVEAIDTARLRARFPAAAADLGPLGVGAWPGVLGYALLDEDGAARFAAGAGLNEDDALPLEFSAPRSLRLRTGPANHALLRAHRRGELPRLTAEGRRDVDTVEARTWIGRAALARGASPEALPHLERARALAPEHLGAALGLCTALLNLGAVPPRTMDLAEHLVARHPGQVDALLLAGLAAGRAGQAVRRLERAVAADPGNELARLALSRARQRAAPGQ